MTALWRQHFYTSVAAVVAIVLLFMRDASAMAWQWWNSSTYGHCLFIPPIVAWLLWQRRDELAEVEPRGWLPGLIFVGGAAFLWLLGEAAGVSLVRHVSLVAMIQAVTLAIMGPAVFRAILFPVIYLVFLIPVGDEFVPAMQTLTAKMTMGLLNFANVPARIDGVFITTPTGWFEVAEACAGVKFLIAMVAYGALAAHVCFKSWRRRIAFMTLCVCAPVLANGVRAFGTIYAAHLTSVESATGFDHIVYGWFFFAFVMVAVMAISWPFFDRRINDKWLDIVPAAIGRQRGLTAVALASVGVIVLPLLWNETVIAAGRHPLPKAVNLPTIAGWQVVPRADQHPWTPRFDGADHKLLGQYINARGERVDLAIALYGWQEEGRKLAGFAQGAIDPASKWSWSSNAKAVSGGLAQRMLGPGKIEREALTFYVLGGGMTGSILNVKLRTMKARLLGGDQGAAVVIISAEGTHRPAMDSFMRALGPVDKTAASMLAQARGR